MYKQTCCVLTISPECWMKIVCSNWRTVIWGDLFLKHIAEAMHTAGIQYMLLLSSVLLRTEAAIKTLLNSGILSFNSSSSFVKEKFTILSLLVCRKILGFDLAVSEHMLEHSRFISFRNKCIICVYHNARLLELFACMCLCTAFSQRNQDLLAKYGRSIAWPFYCYGHNSGTRRGTSQRCHWPRMFLLS